MLILQRLHDHEREWISSDVLHYEITQTPDTDRRERVRLLADFAHQTIQLENSTLSRVEELHSLGFFTYDALHISCAEFAKADVFLTTDDNIIRIAKREKENLTILVADPLRWLEEMTK